MAEDRNIIIIGASAAGIGATHYVLKHIIPALKAKAQKDVKYHVYTIAPSSRFFFRNATPRVATSTTLMSAEKIVIDLHEGFKQYSPEDFTFIEAAATGLDTAARTVSFQGTKKSETSSLSYHALIVATGSKTYYPAFSSNTNIDAALDAIKTSNENVQKAKSIVIVGGGPTGVEFAGEVAEFRNGKPGWFGKSDPKISITLITADKQLLPSVRPDIAKLAERKLAALGVEVRYNSRVIDTSASKTASGGTTITLDNGQTLSADLFVPAYGVLPNSSWLPKHLLDTKNYLLTSSTLRVDAAGPRVYALGDIASNSRNSAWDIIQAQPVLFTNLRRDLLTYTSSSPDAKPKGKDRTYDDQAKGGQIVPIGSAGGVGEVFGWKVPNWAVWWLKSRDYMLAMGAGPMLSGKNYEKEVKWTKEEAAI